MRSVRSGPTRRRARPEGPRTGVPRFAGREQDREPFVTFGRVFEESGELRASQVVVRIAPETKRSENQPALQRSDDARSRDHRLQPEARQGIRESAALLVCWAEHGDIARLRGARHLARGIDDSRAWIVQQASHARGERLDVGRPGGPPTACGEQPALHDRSELGGALRAGRLHSDPFAAEADSLEGLREEGGRELDEPRAAAEGSPERLGRPPAEELVDDRIHQRRVGPRKP